MREALHPETKLTTKFRFTPGGHAKDDETQAYVPTAWLVNWTNSAYADGRHRQITITPPPRR